MLWSYAKLPVAPPAVVFALVHKITDQLVLQAHRPDGASTFDAQVRCFWLLLSAHQWVAWLALWRLEGTWGKVGLL
jgi:hypothetical protein